jgi:uncharacterized protein YndB with AHSA1/START domain
MLDLTLTTSWVVASPRKAVFEAWLDPSTLAKFISHDEDLVAEDIHINPVAEGRYHYTLAGDPRMTVEGTYLEIDPFTTLRFTYETTGTSRSSVVAMNFRPVAEGCQISLTHTGFGNSIMRDLQLLRWEAVLRNLAELFARPLSPA